METDTRSKTRRHVRVKRAFRKRWVWVCIVALVWILVLTVTVIKFGPKTSKPGEKTDTSRFKFIHCDQCNTEMPYNKELDGKKCSKCQPPKPVGFYVATEKSLKSGGGALSPWMKIYMALFVETVVFLGIVTFLLYMPVPDPNSQFFVVACPYCNQRLRYRAVSHGGLGSCSRCKRMIRFPDEHDAVTEEAVILSDQAAARAEAERAAAEAEQQ